MSWLLEKPLYYVLSTLLRYRKDIINENLKLSFPGLEEASILSLGNLYYRHLSRIIIESLKGFYFSTSQAIKRMRVINPEVINADFDQGRDVVILGAHYNNWEWGTLAMPPQLSHKVVIIYKPLSNPFLNRWLKTKRERTGAELWQLKDFFLNRTDQDSPTCYILLADQGPINMKKAIWTNFLNQSTACSGYIELMTKKLDCPVYYSKVNSSGDHYYTVEFIELAENSRSVNEGQIIKDYMLQLETQVCHEPSRWLWSHNRWKRSRE